MDKNYKDMTQEELEGELVEIVKRNYEKGILLLDHNFSLKRIRNITEIQDVEDIDALICIMRFMEYMPNMKKYFLKETDKIEFKLVQIIGDKAIELLSFSNFSSIDDRIMSMYLADRLKDKYISYGTYPVVQILNGKFIGTLAVMLYNEEPYLDCAKNEFHIMCENVYGERDLYMEVMRRLHKNK